MCFRKWKKKSFLNNINTFKNYYSRKIQIIFKENNRLKFQDIKNFTLFIDVRDVSRYADFYYLFGYPVFYYYCILLAHTALSNLDDIYMKL